MEAAYRPTVTGELDTQNFEKFPEVSSNERNAAIFNFPSFDVNLTDIRDLVCDKNVI